MGGDVFQAGSARNKGPEKPPLPRPRPGTMGGRSTGRKEIQDKKGKQNKKPTRITETALTEVGGCARQAAMMSQTPTLKNARTPGASAHGREPVTSGSSTGSSPSIHPRAVPPRTFCLELAGRSTLASNFQRPFRFCLLTAGITDVRHQIWPVSLL